MTQDWLAIADRNQSPTNPDPLERLLVRAVIDADYQEDLWFDAWYYKPFAGGKTDALGMLTSLYHFTNVTKPGRYWRYDGYAYRNTEGLGNDAFLGLLGLNIRGDLSMPMQKYASHQILGPIADATLPPSYLIAQDAFNEMLASSQSAFNQRKTWIRKLRYTDDYILSSGFDHLYASEEIAGLPQDLQKLGTVMHMAQDLAMPHHAQGIAGLCHTAIENYMNELICQGAEKPSDEIYELGNFDDARMPDCQALYNVNAVEKLMATDPLFDIHSEFSLEDRLIRLAESSALLRVRPRDDRNANAVSISIEDGVLFSGTCDEIRSQAIRSLAGRQYAWATAATVMLLELSAYEYGRSGLCAPCQSVMNPGGFIACKQ